jgi:hypothetical protein
MVQDIGHGVHDKALWAVEMGAAFVQEALGLSRGKNV